MDHKDNANGESLEPTPVFEADSPQEPPKGASKSALKDEKPVEPENIQEETPDDLTASDIGGISESTEIPSIDESAFNDEGSGSKKKILFIVGGLVIFILIFALILTFLFGLRKGGSSEKVAL